MVWLLAGLLVAAIVGCSSPGDQSPSKLVIGTRQVHKQRVVVCLPSESELPPVEVSDPSGFVTREFRIGPPLTASGMAMMKQIFPNMVLGDAPSPGLPAVRLSARGSDESNVLVWGLRVVTTATLIDTDGTPVKSLDAEASTTALLPGGPPADMMETALNKALEKLALRIADSPTTRQWLTGTGQRTEGDQRLVPERRRRTTTHGTIRNVHVLIIGIGDYTDPSIPCLKYTERDAKAVHGFFKNSPDSPAKPDNVHLLSETPNSDGLIADRRGIMLAIHKYLVRKAVHKDDMAILYFAGHGDIGAHPTKGTEYYLIPQDAEKDGLCVTAIELSEFQRTWDTIGANTKILIADACNSGGFSGVRGMAGQTGVEAIRGQAKAVFSACKSDEKSIECDSLKHGLFTYVLLDGLKGKADCNNDDRVTLAELKVWLDTQVPIQARKVGGKQTPITSVVDAWGDVYMTR